jgi:[ribosomal protein S5]-alanine N-acetyltransferase
MAEEKNMELFSKPIKTERLLLRPFIQGDAPAMFANWASDPEVTRFLTWNPHKDVEESQKILDRWLEDEKLPRHYKWGIVYERSLIGSIDMVEELSAGTGFEIGYVIGRDYWNRGLMSEAFHAVINYMFEKAGYAYCRMRAQTTNVPSRRIIEKEGFTLDFIDDSYYLAAKDRTVPLATYTLTKEE